MVNKQVNHDELRDGPLRDRSCTDMLFCIFFFAFITAMSYIGYYGYQHGDPNAVIYPYDSAGYQCGRPETNVSAYPYVYFLNPFDPTSKKWKVCLKECPSKNTTTTNCFVTKWVTSCDFTVDPSGNSTGTTLHFNPVESIGMLERLCMPTATNEYFSSYIGKTEMMSAGADIIRTRWVILGTLGVALVLSIIYLLLMRYLVGFIVWLSILALIILISLFGGFYTRKLYDETNPVHDDALRVRYWAISIACYIVAFFLILITYCLRKSIELAVAIMKSATVFIDDLFSIILVPIFIFLFSTVVYILWVAAVIYVYSSGNLVIDDHANVIAKFQHDQKLQYALYFEVIGIIWINSFKIALLQYIVSFACCVWYFTADKENLESPISRGVTTGLFYHLGSLAFGSFLLSLVIVIKWILVILSKINPVPKGANEVAGFLCKCAVCCADCLERFVNFLDHQAYIRIALTGESFCTAARNAFEAMTANAGRFAALGGINYIFNFLGKVVITVGTTYAGFYYITHQETFKDSIYSPLGPTVVFAISSYLVSALFMGVYETAADTIIQTFILDEKINGGSSLFAPEPIKEFVKDFSDDS